MNLKNILTENFLTDFFKKLFKSSESQVYKNFTDDPKVKAKIKSLAKNMKGVEKYQNSKGRVWKPELGGWVDKKTGKRPTY